MPTRSGEFISGFRDTLPLVVGAIPFGILFGALAVTAGLSLWATVGLSLFVFAGSSQFIAATLVGQGAGVGLIVLTTFVVNLRHALYSASMGPFLRGLSWRWLVPLAHTLTDETYAVVIQRYNQHDQSPCRHWYFFGSSTFMYLNWQICTVIGIVAGQSLTGLKDWGLEFALVVTFVGIVVPLLVSLPMLLCAVVSAAVATLATDLPNQSGLMLAAVIGISCGYIAELLTSPSAQSTNKESDANPD